VSGREKTWIPAAKEAAKERTQITFPRNEDGELPKKKVLSRREREKGTSTQEAISAPRVHEEKEMRKEDLCLRRKSRRLSQKKKVTKR